MLYRNLSSYLREKYGKRLKKICIDGGFSCPNRDGKCGTGGCIFCGERGAGEHIDNTQNIRNQVLRAIEKERDDVEFVAYFQNFTNTYADVETLRERYDSALISDRIKVLSIGTRPDCIDRETAELLSGYMKKREVWVELGLQTASDKTAKTINRGYTRDVFERALKILEEYGIKTIVHIILGLPGETVSDCKATADYISGFNLFGVKIHSLYVMEGTKLADMYKRGEYSSLSLEDYTEGAAYALSRLSPDTVIHRLTGDCPDGMLISPEWVKNKHNVIREIEKVLSRDKLQQGSLYKKS